MASSDVLAIERLSADDVAGGLGLSDGAGWNQTDDDWRRFVRLAPAGCLAATARGRLVATTTTTRYGRDLAWIGMVLTAPEFRGQGLASRLMARTLELGGKAAFLSDRSFAGVPSRGKRLGGRRSHPKSFTP